MKRGVERRKKRRKGCAAPSPESSPNFQLRHHLPLSFQPMERGNERGGRGGGIKRGVTLILPRCLLYPAVSSFTSTSSLTLGMGRRDKEKERKRGKKEKKRDAESEI